MSTYWGYYCKTCEENSEHWFNHGEKQLEEFFIARGIINKYDFAFVKIYTLGNWATGDIHEFLDRHEGHDICLHSEYGQIKDFAVNEQPDRP